MLTSPGSGTTVISPEQIHPRLYLLMSIRVGGCLAYSMKDKNFRIGVAQIW